MIWKFGLRIKSDITNPTSQIEMVVEILKPADRFLDPGTKIYEFYDEFLVVCPKCASCAKVVIDQAAFEKLSKRKTDENRNNLFGPRKFVCLHCVYRQNWKGHQIKVGGNFDWYFGFPLWLEISCCSEKLWAYNLKHLELIEQYVGAKLRERTRKGRNSFFSKLPTWMKSAKNREEVLRAIAKLKEKNYGSY